MKICNCSLAGTKACRTCSNHPYSYHIVNDLIDSRKTIVETVLEDDRDEYSESDWIPCSDRLPENGENVLATTAWGDVTIAERVYPPINDTCWFIHDGNTNATIDDVIAWLPLPESYKG